MPRNSSPKGDAEPEAEQSEEIDEVVVQIEGEPPPPEEDKAPAPEWVRELRKSHRELQRKNRELEAKLQTATPATENKPVELGRKPNIEEHDYDVESYEAALSNWFERKRVVEEQHAKARLAEEQLKQEWQAKLDSYGKAKSQLKVRDYEDAEEVAQQTFNVTQQGIILQGAENPALVVYALGKNHKRAKELASISDPVKFAFAIAKLERDLKVTNRSKSAPPPEKTVSGNGSLAGSVDSTLDRLRAEAEKTGNYTKVLQYKQQQRAKSK